MRALFLISLIAMSAHSESPRRIEYRHVDGRTLGALVYSSIAGSALARHPAVLLFHGGGWVVGEPNWPDDAARKFAALGMTAISIEYRLADNKATPADALDDACAAFAWIRQHAAAFHVDDQRIAGYGVSAGGQLVTMAAMRCKSDAPKVLLLVSPMLDLTGNGYFAGLMRANGDVSAYSPIEHIDDTTPPTLIIQGSRDSITPTDAARRFCDAMHAHHRVCELALYDNLGHVLSRDLQDQESGIDIDEAALTDSESRMQRFLREHGILPTVTPTDQK
jgi:acetyl esterase/lipase